MLLLRLLVLISLSKQYNKNNNTSFSSIGDDGWSVISTTTAGKSLLSNVKIDSYSRMYLYQTIPSTI